MTSTITYFSKKQALVEAWVLQEGFNVRAEVDVEQYRADLFIKELDLIIEIDGPSHRKLKKEGNLITINSPKISERDKVLLKYSANKIWHIPVDLEFDIFKEEFNKIIQGIK